MTIFTRRRYEGPLFVDPRIARLLRVHLRLTVTYWRADGSRDCEIPFVRGKRHGTATFWRADGTVGDVKEWAHGVRMK